MKTFDVALTIARPRAYFSQEPNAIVVRDLDVSFTCEKSLESEPNTCTVIVRNFAPATRAEIQRKPLHIRLEAGWDGNLETVFVGDLRYAESYSDGPTILTEMTVADGGRAYSHARVNRSFVRGSSALQVLQDVAAQMNLTVPKNASDAQELITQYAAGASVYGNASKQLTAVLKPHKMSWSVQNGRLQILRDGDTNSATAILISQDTGLINSPRYGEPKEKGKPPVLTASTTLKPSVIPGCLIRVESRDLRGSFRVERARHSGDTYQGVPTTEIEAKPL